MPIKKETVKPANPAVNHRKEKTVTTEMVVNQEEKRDSSLKRSSNEIFGLPSYKTTTAIKPRFVMNPTTVMVDKGRMPKIMGTRLRSYV